MQTTTFIPETAPFGTDQRLWLNGYMAGLLAGKNFVPANQNGSEKNSATIPLLILFGSQTGTAEKLAKQIAKESKSRGCNSRVVDAAEHAKIDWSKETNLLVVTSTYGDGDMPDNAQAFWDWLQTDVAKSLSHLNYSVLALGDTNYENFCAAGKKIDARLEQLGAKRIHPLDDCDLDYEAKAKNWQNGVLKFFGSAGVPPVVALDVSSNVTPALAYNRNNPFPARLLTNRKLTADGSEKETRHFEISLEDSGLNYEVGDALGIFPKNCPELVADILHSLNFSGDEMVLPNNGGEIPIRKALAEFYDITKPSPELLKFIGERNSVLRDLLAPGHKDDLKNFLWGREVIDLLLETPDAKLSPKEFVSLLKKLAPRLYSISSSPKSHAGQVHLTVSIVRYESHGRARKGLASTFLADHASENPVPVFVQTSHGFRLPTNSETPIIMVGPGTGVAPFRAFLHERRAVGATGKNWLFFGEQRVATDFYYRDELEKMFSDGHLTKLSTAFSRDQKEKIYVQNRMLENAVELWSWLEAGAHFYVCGDASRMAKDVDDALHKIIETAGGKSADDAKAYVAKLKTDKRYQRDVY
ncbi:MAG TPA: sulfite reductase subunit alpha [Methylomirabilota bacterium]|nr:sulfite reductase subunit alpha [Methylomirabilota bacterium]